MNELFFALLKGLLGKIVTDEFSAGCQAFAEWLVRKSAGRLATDRDRYLEQWLADLNDRKSSLQKLFFAFGIVIASAVLRQPAASVRRALGQPIILNESHTITVITSEDPQDVGLEHNMEIVCKLHDAGKTNKHWQVLQIKFKSRRHDR
jgi:hypothetical protein